MILIDDFTVFKSEFNFDLNSLFLLAIISKQFIRKGKIGESATCLSAEQHKHYDTKYKTHIEPFKNKSTFL